MNKASARITLAISLLANVTVWDFARRVDSYAPPEPLPEVAVVFTGQFVRVHAGLDLMRTGAVERLFISGVNPRAGIRIDDFANQFGLEDDLKRSLENGDIVLGPRAATTLQNAEEVRCWLSTEGYGGPLLLVTSDLHMPRASVALAAAVPDRTVERFTVPEFVGGEGAIPSIRKEYLQYIATQMIVLLPARAGAWVRRQFGQPEQLECT